MDWCYGTFGFCRLTTLSGILGEAEMGFIHFHTFVGSFWWHWRQGGDSWETVVGQETSRPFYLHKDRDAAANSPDRHSMSPKRTQGIFLNLHGPICPANAAGRHSAQCHQEGQKSLEIFTKCLFFNTQIQIFYQFIISSTNKLISIPFKAQMAYCRISTE